MAYQAKPAMHDIGGREAGPVDPSDHPLEPWHKMATAMSNVLGDGDHKLTCTDEARRTREALDQESYDAGYFERQILSLRDILIEKGILDADEIGQRMAEVEKRIAKEGR